MSALRVSLQLVDRGGGVGGGRRGGGGVGGRTDDAWRLFDGITVANTADNDDDDEDDAAVGGRGGVDGRTDASTWI